MSLSRCGVEKYIEGPYRKHNNNYGYVSQEERNTPQAFSHFTYEASQHTLLICDIQGVGDLYTDPQVHTMDQRRLGKGDLGKRGIDKFLETHRCNPICRYLKLPALNDGDFADEGTLPSSTLMAYTQIRSENIYLSPSSPSLEPSQLPLLARRPSIPTTSKQRANLCDCCTIL